MAEQSERALTGRTLRGKWRLEGQIGAGGMAQVWAARHRNGKRAAIKILHPSLAKDEALRKRFLREGYVANKVGHPGVAAVLDDDTDEDLVFLVMELLDGQTLSERWRASDRKLGLAEVLRIAAEVLDVLASAHENGIVHRDVKPANIFLTSADEVKVLDFGIARLKEPENSSSGNTTRVGATLGSPSFMSPEQARARWEFVDQRTDLWAVGAVMFTMLSGEHVHEGAVGAEILIATATQTPRSLRIAWPDAPDVVAAIVDRALAFERTDRWQDARAMQAAVERARKIDFSKSRPESASLPDVSFAPTLERQNPLADAEQLLHAIQGSAARAAEEPQLEPLLESQGPTTQATGLMKTLERTKEPPLSVPPPPESSPGRTAIMQVNAAPPSPLAPAALAMLANKANEDSSPSGLASAPSPPPYSSVPTSIGTLAMPATQPPRSPSALIILGSFIAVGLIAGGLVFGLLMRHPVAASDGPPTARAAIPDPPPAILRADPIPEPVETAAASAPAPSATVAPKPRPFTSRKR